MAACADECHVLGMELGCMLHRSSKVSTASLPPLLSLRDAAAASVAVTPRLTAAFLAPTVVAGTAAATLGGGL